jgi:branched-chain amino acid transport system substrate-binding protein
MGRIIAERLKPKRVAMIYEIDDFEIAVRDGVKEGLGKYGIPLEPIIKYSPGEVSDFRPLLAKLREAEPKPDLAYLAIPAATFPTVCIQAKKMGFDIPIVTDYTNHFQNVIDIAGDAVEGVYLNTAFFYSKEHSDPLVAKFVRGIQEKYGHEPSPMTIWGYEAMYMLAEALKVNCTDRKAIRDALMKVKRDGALGHLEFDKDGDVLFTGDIPLKIENGKFVLWKNK